MCRFCFSFMTTRGCFIVIFKPIWRASWTCSGRAGCIYDYHICNTRFLCISSVRGSLVLKSWWTYYGIRESQTIHWYFEPIMWILTSEKVMILTGLWDDFSPLFFMVVRGVIQNNCKNNHSDSTFRVQPCGFARSAERRPAAMALAAQCHFRQIGGGYQRLIRETTGGGTWRTVGFRACCVGEYRSKHEKTNLSSVAASVQYGCQMPLSKYFS